MLPRVRWLFSKAAALPESQDWLGPTETGVLAGLRVPKRRDDWLLGRWVAKQAVLPELETDLSDQELARLEILPGISGAPEARLDGVAVPVTLSLSHRSGAAFCAVLRNGVVGCDLEWVEDRSQAFVQDYFASAERAIIDEADCEARRRWVISLWSAKESVLKLLGLGLSVDTRSVEIAAGRLPPAGRWGRFTALHRQENRRYEGWWRARGRWILTIATGAEGRPPLAVGHRRDREG